MASKEATEGLESVASNLFFGEINQNDVFPFPHFSDDQVEMAKTMTDALNKFAEGQVDSTKFDHEAKIPEEVIRGYAELGLCGLAVPEEFGGLALDATLYSRVFQEIAGIDGSSATMLGAHQSIGYKALLNEGTDEQKAKYLPKLASGEWFAAFCLTEPGSGSDAYSIKTKAVENSDGTFTINGQKLWITNGGYAHFYTVFAKTMHEKEGKTIEKISCFIVEKGVPGSEGLTFGEKEDKMGIRASETRAVFFDNVVIPKENILGELGKGFKIAMNVLNTGRLSLGTGSVGGMKAGINLAVAHAKERKQFDKSITEFGLIQEKIAKMNTLCYTSECAVYLTTGLIGRGLKNYAIESAICKVYNSEALWQVADMCTQIGAGIAYMKEYPYERLMRDSRINLIFEGTNEILRCFIALMGIKEPSEELKKLGKVADVSNALADPIKSLGVLVDFGKRRIGKMIGTRTLTKCHPDFQDSATSFSSMLNDFAIAVENALFKYGRKIVDHELPQKRISEMAIDLYVTLAVLSRTTAILENEKIAQDKKDYCKALAKLGLRDLRRRFKTNLRHMNNNSDEVIKEISEFGVKYDGYGLDVVDF